MFPILGLFQMTMTKLFEFLWSFPWTFVSLCSILHLQHYTYTVHNDVQEECISSDNKRYCFFLYTQFALFRTKNLQSPGTYIYKSNWDPSWKVIKKETDSWRITVCVSFRGDLCKLVDWESIVVGTGVSIVMSIVNVADTLTDFSWRHNIGSSESGILTVKLHILTKTSAYLGILFQS